jgi:hypothetical protein
VDDPLSRIDPSAPLVPAARLLDGFDDEIKEGNNIQQQAAKDSDVSDFTVTVHKQDDDLKLPAYNKSTDTESDVRNMEEPKKGPATKKSKGSSPKEMSEDLECILKSPVRTGPPKH